MRLAPKTPIFGGAASEEGTVFFDAPPAAPAEPAAAATATAPEPKGNARVVIGAIAAALVLGGLSAGAWLMQAKPHAASASHPVVVVHSR